MDQTASAPPTGPLRRGLNLVYDAGAALAALSLVALLAVIVAQMVARWTGQMFRGGPEYAGYLMAAASFLAYAHTLNRGAHIRVGLGLTALGRHRFWGELFCLIVGSAAALYLAWYAARMVFWSRKLGDVSQGQDMTQLWIVQTPVMIGAMLLAVAFVDNLISLVRTGRDNIRDDGVAKQIQAE
ncbi:TRAP transporter small permease subunit [uncultured Paracoccus sp.]|uniref:TRAP transporter small permease n=1 Tax=uncultured Paracoccus sp. TaxID=189685 RepID=UPI00261B54C5|nr:TRAP transporter small permease subunit [uncultured Paracoccus sp.]